MRTSVKLIWQNVQKSSQQLITRTLHVHYTYIVRDQNTPCRPIHQDVTPILSRYISCKLSKLTKNIEQHSRVVIRQTVMLASQGYLFNCKFIKALMKKQNYMHIILRTLSVA